MQSCAIADHVQNLHVTTIPCLPLIKALPGWGQGVALMCYT